MKLMCIQISNLHLHSFIYALLFVHINRTLIGHQNKYSTHITKEHKKSSNLGQQHSVDTLQIVKLEIFILICTG